MDEDIVPKGIEEILQLAEEEGYIEIVKEKKMTEEEKNNLVEKEIIKRIDCILDKANYLDFEGKKEYISFKREYLQDLFDLCKKQQKEIESMQKNYEAKIDKMEYEMGYDYISKEVIRKEIKKLNEKNGIAFDMDTGKILKTKEDYQIAILKKLLRRK